MQPPLARTKRREHPASAGTEAATIAVRQPYESSGCGSSRHVDARRVQPLHPNQSSPGPTHPHVVRENGASASRAWPLHFWRVAVFPPHWQAPSTPLPALQSLGSGVAQQHTLGQYLALPPALRGTPHPYSRLFIEAAYSIVIVLMLVTAAESAMI